jgi:hypothetical protein
LSYEHPSSTSTIPTGTVKAGLILFSNPLLGAKYPAGYWN